LCFAATILSCALKHYLISAIHTSDLCSYLCPSFLPGDSIIFPIFFEKLFALQSWFLHLGQNLLNINGSTKNLIFSNLIMAPLIEESMYRGPLFLMKHKIGCYVWWFLALFLCLIFALSHRNSGLSLLPLFVLGLSSSWLILKTERFWPSVVLHFLYNFQVIAFPFYQSTIFGY
jgi:membrane protease YdiL (CAAX protease family)